MVIVIFRAIEKWIRIIFTVTEKGIKSDCMLNSCDWEFKQYMGFSFELSTSHESVFFLNLLRSNGEKQLIGGASTEAKEKLKKILQETIGLEYRE